MLTAVVLVIVAVLVVLGLVVADIVMVPPPASLTSCDLDRNIVLPDTCLCASRGRPGCPAATTKPYFIFFRQAATCSLGCIDLR